MLLNNTMHRTFQCVTSLETMPTLRVWPESNVLLEHVTLGDYSKRVNAIGKQLDKKNRAKLTIGAFHYREGCMHC